MRKTASEKRTVEAALTDPHPTEPLGRARLQAEVAKQRVRIAKEELKRARKRLKEAKREAKRARKHAVIARKALKKARRAHRGSADGTISAQPVKAAARRADTGAKPRVKGGKRPTRRHGKTTVVTLPESSPATEPRD